MARRRRVEMLVSVSLQDGNWNAGEICTLPQALAEDLVRSKVAKYHQSIVRPRARGSRDHAREPWCRTLREGDDYQWQITLKLPHLLKPRIHAKYDENGSARKSHLREIGGNNNDVNPAQAKAINYFVKHEATLYPKMLRSIAKYAAEFRPDWLRVNPKLADRLVPAKITAQQVEQRIAFTTMQVHTRSRDGIAYLEFLGECTWDREHGIVAVLHRNRIVGIYQQGTGWIDRSPRKKRSN